MKKINLWLGYLFSYQLEHDLFLAQCVERKSVEKDFVSPAERLSGLSTLGD